MNYSKDLITTLVEKLECCEFKKGESLMDQGDVGDCMYIICKGECGVYVFNLKKRGEAEQTHRAVAILNKNTVVGETAVVDKFDTGKRSATVVAHEDVTTLSLTKKDYQQILY